MVDHSLLQDFITEATEHLEEMESSLLALEKDPDSRETLDEIFRAIHSIKGASQFVGLERISELSHKMENLLDLLRQFFTHHADDRRELDILIVGAGSSLG